MQKFVRAVLLTFLVCFSVQAAFHPCDDLMVFLGKVYRFNGLVDWVPVGAEPHPLHPFYGRYSDINVRFLAANQKEVVKYFVPGAGRTEAEVDAILTRESAVDASDKSYRILSAKKLLPDHVKSRVGTYANCDGPDCYNAVKHFLMGTPASQAVADLQADFFADFDELKRGSEIRYGDVIAFQKINPQTEFEFTIHVATYLGGDMVYHKFGPPKAAGYEFHSLLGIFSYYHTIAQSGRDIYPGMNDSKLGMALRFYRLKPKLPRK